MLEYAGSLVNNGLGFSPGPGIAAPVVFSASVKTTVNKPISGIHRLCYVLGTSGTTVDHIYDNGQEFDSYGTQGAGAGTQTGSFLTIGAANVSPWSTTGLFGSTVYRALPFASALTPAQVLAVDQNMVGNLIDRGVQPSPTLPVLSAPQLVFVGDSLTACYQVSPSTACWNQNLTLVNQPSYVKTVLAVTGLTALAISGAEPGRVGQYCNGTQGNANVILWVGTNDLASFAKETPQLVAQNIWGAVDRLSAAGCNVYLATVISRGGNAGDGGTFETERQTLNALLRQGLKAHSARGIVDLAANPYLGATGANASSTYFYPDNVHVIAAGQPLIEAAVNNALNFYNGSTLSAPAIYTASATLPASARVVDATGCTSACAFLLPDGTGPTGEEYTILTGSVAVTVQGQTLYGQAQTVNGSASAVTLPGNTRVTLRTVALPQATAGVRWVM
jgi:lysophospholipase L1-like esterase